MTNHRALLAVAGLALLQGCAVVPPAAWNFDPSRPAAKQTLPVEEVNALTDRLAQLQIERNEVRTRIAAEPDAGKRLALYSRLHAIGTRLGPLERRIATVAAAR